MDKNLPLPNENEGKGDEIEVINIENNKGKYKGADFISNIPYEFKDDVLYNIIKRAHREDDVITKPIIDGLAEGRLYSTPDVAEFLKIATSTLRSWILELYSYVEVVEQGRNLKCDYKAVIKLRLIQMLREDNEYPVAKLKEITMGISVEDGKEEKERSLNEKVEILIDKVEIMEQSINSYGKIFQQILDPEALKTNKIIINSNLLIPLLESSEKMEKERTQNLNRIEEVMNGKIDKEELDGDYPMLNLEKLQEIINKAIEDSNKKKTFGQKLKELFK